MLKILKKVQAYKARRQARKKFRSWFTTIKNF